MRQVRVTTRWCPSQTGKSFRWATSLRIMDVCNDAVKMMVLIEDERGNNGVCENLTLLASLLVLRLCCIARDSDMSVTGLWIFFRSPLYFTCKRDITEITLYDCMTLKLQKFSSWIIDRYKYNPKYTPHLQVYWHLSKFDKSYCSSSHTVVSFLSSPCQTSLCISPFWAKVELADNNENNASRVSRNSNAK